MRVRAEPKPPPRRHRSRGGTLRKHTLIDYGFRLSSALGDRPLPFEYADIRDEIKELRRELTVLAATSS